MGVAEPPTIADRAQAMREGAVAAIGAGASATEFVASAGFTHPCPGSELTSKYGMRFHPVHHRNMMHSGVDFAAPHGSPIKAFADGIVTFSGRRNGYGNLIEIRHANGMTTRYGHNDRNAVQEGQRVHAGDTIGTVGATGTATGPHVHFEVRNNGVPEDPMRFVRGEKSIPGGVVPSNSAAAADNSPQGHLARAWGSGALAQADGPDINPAQIIPVLMQLFGLIFGGDGGDVPDFLQNFMALLGGQVPDNATYDPGANRVTLDADKDRPSTSGAAAGTTHGAAGINAAFLGVFGRSDSLRYRLGGTGEGGVIDCSAFTQDCMIAAGFTDAPRTSAEQGRWAQARFRGEPFNAANLQAGDLIVMDGHVVAVAEKDGKLFVIGSEPGFGDPGVHAVRADTWAAAYEKLPVFKTAHTYHLASPLGGARNVAGVDVDRRTSFLGRMPGEDNRIVNPFAAAVRGLAERASPTFNPAPAYTV